MPGYYWQIDKVNTVSIEIALDNRGSASFNLSAMRPGGASIPVKTVSNQGAAGKAVFELGPLTEDALVKVQVECFSPAAPGSGVWHSVSQNDAIVACQDDDDAVVNKTGDEFAPVKIGEVQQGQIKTFQFTVELAAPSAPTVLSTARIKSAKPAKAPKGRVS